ncbi:MAG: hypothetical protein ACKPKO_63535, partial [Candidatus Fonsibacter sp.]
MGALVILVVGAALFISFLMSWLSGSGSPMAMSSVAHWGFLLRESACEMCLHMTASRFATVE